METLATKLGKIAEAYGIRDVYAFGSRASEVARRLSDPNAPRSPSTADLDVGVQPVAGPILEPRDRVRLATELEDLFDVPRVDLVVVSEAGAFLAVEVIKGELLHTADPLAQAEHELYVLRRAADLAPLQRERIRAILEEGAR